MNTDHRRDERPSSVVFLWRTFSPLPRRFDTARHGQPGQARAGHSTGDNLGAVPEMRPSWGSLDFLTSSSRLRVAGVLRFACGSMWVCAAFLRLWDGVSLGFLLGFLACSHSLWRAFRLCQIPPQVGVSLCSLSVRLLNDLCSTVVRAGSSPASLPVQ